MNFIDVDMLSFKSAFSFSSNYRNDARIMCGDGIMYPRI